MKQETKESALAEIKRQEVVLVSLRKSFKRKYGFKIRLPRIKWE